jgi:hypothetical protein
MVTLLARIGHMDLLKDEHHFAVTEGDTFRSSLMIGAASEPAPAPGPSCPSLRPTSRG